MNIQTLFNGISLGAVYALIAVGFAVVFNILKFSNFSHGGLMTVTAYLGFYVATHFKANLPITIIAAMLGGGLLSLLGELFAFRKITINKSPTIYYFVSSITLGTLYENLMTIVAGSNFYGFPQFFKNSNISIGRATVATSDAVMFLLSAIALFILMYIIRKTKIGRALRAVSFDRDTASLMGINVIFTIQVAFFIAGALGGLSGVFLGVNYTIYPQLGQLVTKGFIASVLGGLGSLEGAVIGAMLLGIVETILTYFVGAGYTPIFVFIIMLIFLLVRPIGIAGSNVQEKA
ncbi:branched-chain amino acid ABC transporter permease [Thermoanaerobacterium thermosaccharolyticum]|uniref:branched-chain amino acid ABC transporter permease n=1 Tax=Thermoanaerobacterium thermosaccharolyticum TaxID=1517 RepID=UPI003DA86BD5